MMSQDPTAHGATTYDPTRLQTPHGSASYEAVLADDFREVLPELLGLIGDFVWIAAFFFFIRSSYRRKFCLFPAIGICVNFSWEVFYNINFDGTPLKRVIFLTWLILNSIVLFQLFIFGKSQVRWTPRFNTHFRLIIISFIAFALTAQVTYYFAFKSIALGFSAYMVNAVSSAGFMFFFFNRPKRSLHSFRGAWLKFIGTGLITVANLILINGDFQGTILFFVFLMFATTLFDIAYLVMLHSLPKSEKTFSEASAPEPLPA